MHSVEIFVLLLALVAGVPLLAERIHVPYPTLLVMTGLSLCFVPGLPRFHLNPDLVFLFVLPPLIYRAAILTSWRDFKANLRPILLLGIGLVIFTTLAIGYVAKLAVPSLPWAAAFVLGAIVSPSDTVAAIAVMQRLPVPKRVVTVLEGESLINDATGLIAYKFAIAAVLTGAFSLKSASGHFAWAIAGGLVIGWLTYRLAAFVQSHLDNPPVQAVISLLTPFIAFLPADRLGASGIIAVVTVGVGMGWRTNELVSARMRLLVLPMWEMIEFVLNGFIFISIGLTLPDVVHNLSGIPTLILARAAAAVCAAVMIVRVLWVFPATYLPRFFSRRLRKRDPLPRSGAVALVSWIGMRGVVSLAAALALPLVLKDGSGFPARDMIIFLTFAVILFTLVVQGLSLAPLVRWLNLPREDNHNEEHSRAWRQATEAALLHLEKLGKERKISSEALARTRQKLEAEIALCDDVQSTSAIESGRASLFSSLTRVEHEVVHAQRRAIVSLRNEGSLSNHAAREILRELDLAEASLH